MAQNVVHPEIFHMRVNELNKILESNLAKDELEFIKFVLEKKKIPKTNFKLSAGRAKVLSEILFANRDKLRKEKSAILLYRFLINYYDHLVYSNLIFSEGALEPEGMCDLKSTGTLVYRSIY